MANAVTIIARMIIRVTVYAPVAATGMTAREEHRKKNSLCAGVPVCYRCFAECLLMQKLRFGIPFHQLPDGIARIRAAVDHCIHRFGNRHFHIIQIL